MACDGQLEREIEIALLLMRLDSQSLDRFEITPLPCLVISFDDSGVLGQC